MFQKILVANRGEIAVRIERTLRDLDIASVAVFSEADRDALHVRYADEAYCIGPPPSQESYLIIDRIIDVALKSGAQAVHPGYGFLSENPKFAAACEDAGIVFIGPPAEAIRVMGEKTLARRTMAAAGVPVVPGTDKPIADEAEAIRTAEEVGFPMLIKAAAGGGGKGMRLVTHQRDFVAAYHAAKREARSAFADDSVYIERFITEPRHVEFQIMADRHGNVIHLFERDCSIQRRHQKIIEETPCPVLKPDTRAAKAVDYVGAGTIEFLLDPDHNFYFLEMNTRLQVEHPITEMVTGVDLVREQVEVANGAKLRIAQEDLAQRGCAIEARVYAEDPDHDFLPNPGKITYLRQPGGPGVRDDTGVYSGSTIPVYYDPLISKLVTWAEDRPRAIARMRRALEEYIVRGIRTNISFHKQVLEHADFLSGHYDTSFVERLLESGIAPHHNSQHGKVAMVAACVAAYLQDQQIQTGNSSQEAQVGGSANNWKLLGRMKQLNRW